MTTKRVSYEEILEYLSDNITAPCWTLREDIANKTIIFTDSKEIVSISVSPFWTEVYDSRGNLPFFYEFKIETKKKDLMGQLVPKISPLNEKVVFDIIETVYIEEKYLFETLRLAIVFIKQECMF